MRPVLWLLLTALVLAPLAQAHGAPNPIEAEDLILDDEATDTTIAWDGFDIQTVHIREAYLQMQDGLVVRWTLWGGNSIGLASTHTVELAFESPARSISWDSMDNGANWTEGAHGGDMPMPMGACGDGFVLETLHEQDDVEGQLIPTWNVQFQAFVPLCALGVTVGDSLDNAVATAYADGVRVDAAPGGYYHSAAPDQELQDPGLTSERLIDSLLLDGPDRYTKSNVTFAEGVLTIDVENLISVSGQHIFAKTSLQPNGLADEHDEDGNHLAGGQEAGPGEDVTFTFELGEFDAIQVFIETDLGGQEMYWVASNGTVTLDSPHALQGATVNTPSAPVALVGLAVAALAALRRR